MAKQPEEGGVWDGERTGASFGMGTRFRHEGGVEDSLLPDGITSTGSAQEEVILALCHYNVGTLHGSQLGCVGGMSGGWRWDGDAAACREASASVVAAVHHHCGTRGVHGSHGVVSHGDILAHWPNRHVWLHGHEHLSTRVGRGHLRQLTRHLRWKHISGLVYLRICRWCVCVRRCLRRHLHSRRVYRCSALLRVHSLLWIGTFVVHCSVLIRSRENGRLNGALRILSRP